MSASEKLKALWDGWESDDDTQRIHDALPQIVAVVEAAETVGDELDTWEPTERNRARLHNALAALDEALGGESDFLPIGHPTC